jgi:hypothetical protein
MLPELPVKRASPTNVWMVEIEPGEHNTYSLRRMATPRHFRARFDLGREVETPEAPWGRKD